VYKKVNQKKKTERTQQKTKGEKEGRCCDPFRGASTTPRCILTGGCGKQDGRCGFHKGDSKSLPKIKVFVKVNVA